MSPVLNSYDGIKQEDSHDEKIILKNDHENKFQ